MKKDIEQYELIEKYLKKELSDEDMQKVKQQMQTDNDFARGVKQHEDLMNFITEGSLLELKSSIKNIHSNYKNNLFRRIINNRPLLYTLAGLVIISVSILYVNTNKNAKVGSENKIKPIETTTIIQIEKENIRVKTSEQKQLQVIDSEKNIKTNQNEIAEADNKLQQEKEPIVKTDSQLKSEMVDVDQKQEKEAIEPEKKKEPAIQNMFIPDIFDCSQINIIAEVTVENSCIHESTGSIAIDQNKIEGGTPPYKVSIDNKKTYLTELRIDELSAGTYTLWVKDKNSCSDNIGTFWVNTIDCQSETREYIFAPDKQEKWKIPGTERAQTLKVYNQQGMLVYELEINGNANYYWDGSSLSGNALPMGIYSFIINCYGQEDITGNVTIVR